MRDKDGKPLEVGDWVVIWTSQDWQEVGKIIQQLDDGRIVVLANKEYYGEPELCRRVV
jgi:hypothetical protein